MAVQTVRRRVQRAIGKPVDMQVAGIIGDIADLAVGLDPVDSLSMRGPERIGIGNRVGIHRPIAIIIDQRVRNGLLAWCKQSVLSHGYSSHPAYRPSCLDPQPCMNGDGS